MSVDFSGKVAIVTGAGNGLGRSHALALASRGARVVVNDLGGIVGGASRSHAAEEVVDVIRSCGGEAIAGPADVADQEQVAGMVAAAMDAWGRVDILINNAGLLRDRSFAKLTPEDLRLVIDVHLVGTALCSRAVWEIMRAQNYGRIVMTSSSSGLYGNFGQANYGAAKAGVVGLMNVLTIEGAKYGIKVNTIAPTAGTQMVEGLVPSAVFDLMTVESVTAGVMALVSDDAPSRVILCAGAGGYAATRVYETEGVYLPPDQQTPEMVLANLDKILDPAGQEELTQGFDQTRKFVAKAAAAQGIDLGDAF